MFNILKKQHEIAYNMLILAVKNQDKKMIQLLNQNNYLSDYLKKIAFNNLCQYEYKNVKFLVDNNPDIRKELPNYIKYTEMNFPFDENVKENLSLIEQELN